MGIFTNISFRQKEKKEEKILDNKKEYCNKKEDFNLIKSF